MRRILSSEILLGCCFTNSVKTLSPRFSNLAWLIKQSYHQHHNDTTQIPRVQTCKWKGFLSQNLDGALLHNFFKNTPPPPTVLLLESENTITSCLNVTLCTMEGISYLESCWGVASQVSVQIPHHSSTLPESGSKSTQCRNDTRTIVMEFWNQPSLVWRCFTDWPLPPISPSPGTAGFSFVA